MDKKKSITTKSLDAWHEVLLAAVIYYKKVQEVIDYIDFMVEALERNSIWINRVVSKQNSFKCALLTGAGPDRFKVEKIVYPSKEPGIKIELKLHDSQELDKIAISAMLKMSNAGMVDLQNYIKTSMNENLRLMNDLVKGKALGTTYVILRPTSGKQYCVMDKILIMKPIRCLEPHMEKRRKIKKF